MESSIPGSYSKGSGVSKLSKTSVNSPVASHASSALILLNWTLPLLVVFGGRDES